MNAWRKKNPEEAKERGRRTYARGIEKAKTTRLIPSGQFSAAKYGAKKRGLAFTIDQDDVPIPEICPALGIPLDWSDYDHTPSIDRVDNTLGYTPGNVAVISRRANGIKRDASVDELKSIVAYMERTYV